MVRTGLRALWTEPRPARPPVRLRRDWVLLGLAVAASVLEAVLGPDRTWLLAALAVSTVIAVATMWRRTHPLAAIAVAFGTLLLWDVARIVASDATGLWTIGVSLVLPYALLRWGSGREVVIGLAIITVWLGVTHVADPTELQDVIAAYAFFLLSAALGASIRFHASSRLRAVEQAELRQRHELARDLHDTIGHHMSGIVIQAQAGQAMAASGSDRSQAVLRTIEHEAVMALAEMRTIVGVLRAGTEADLDPQPGLSDIERLARATDTPAVEVQLWGRLDDLPSATSVALYRIAQESLTNARRHARNLVRVHIEVAGHDDHVSLTVRDDGARPGTSHLSTSGFGLIGMRERASLLGGTLLAGPGPDRGWVVQATLPTRDPAREPSRVPERTV